MDANLSLTVLIKCVLIKEKKCNKSKGKSRKAFRSLARNQEKKLPRERNWTDLENEANVTLLADGEFNFATTLETKALKKQANKEVFQSILENFKISLADPDFIDENKKFSEEE